MDNQEIQRFAERLGSIPSTDRTTNQYQSGTEGGSIRRSNLTRYLQQTAEHRPTIMLLGEAPGYRGCRLTGIPFTSEAIMLEGIPLLELFGESAGYVRTSTGRLQKEASATIVWETLAARSFVPLLWAAFPFHPHRPDEPLSNRAPTATELTLGRPFWLDLAQLMGIEVIVAIGNHAAQSMAIAGIKGRKIRHPSQGGKPQFVAGIDALLRSPESNSSR